MPLFSEESAKPETPAASSPTPPPDGYTINYNTVSMIEYVRFASKICNTNFIFDEADLNFAVTVVSDAPITPQNVMATLIQVLRIHGLALLEQENNLVIHKATDVVQIATLVTESGQETNAPIVTRIFRVKNAKADSVAGIIRPMISSGALLEISAETRQLILTDITANVDKVAALIEILDAPHTPLEIKTYETMHNSSEYLVEICGQIMTPIAQGNPFILVPQPLARTIFLVSTPDLVARALAVLQNLDTLPKKEVLSQKKLKGENIFVYKAEHRSGEELLKGLQDISSNLQKSGIPEGDLIDTIETAQSIRETNSLMFLGSKESIAKIQEFLASLDILSKEGSLKSSFFIYRPQHKSAGDLDHALKEMAENLEGTKGSDPALIHVIAHAKINKATNTITFSGEEYLFGKIKDLLAAVDIPSSGKNATSLPVSDQFLIYKPVSRKGDMLSKSIQEIVKDLKADAFADPAFLRSLESMKYVKSTNSLLFTGDTASMKRIEALLTTLDVPGSQRLPGSEKTFFLFQPQLVSKTQVENHFHQLAENLDKRGEAELLDTIQSMKWIDSSHSFMFQGSETSIARVKELLQSFDQESQAQHTAKAGYFIYKLQNATGDVIEEDLDTLAKNLKESDVKDSAVLTVIDNIRYVKETNSLLLTGDAAAIEEVKTLIAGYDYPRTSPNTVSSNFFMYKPQHLSAAEIEKSLSEVAGSLKKAELADPNLLQTIHSAKYVKTTNSLIFTGNADSIQKVQTLLKEIDTPIQNYTPIQHIGKTTFLLYKLKNAGGQKIMTSIKSMASDLKKSGHADQDFIDALGTMKYVKETNSLLFTGDEATLKKVQSLVLEFDVAALAPEAAKPAPTTASNFVLYKPLSMPAADLEKLLNDFAENLKLSGLSDPELFNAITSMRLIDKTQTLVFTGSPKALDQTKELLKVFDVPPSGKPASTEPSIQAIDNTSFLVYKLQFHKGDEIQSAMRQIAKDLTASGTPINQNLLNSISSIQWLDITNSLLCSGDQETLTRLKELIKNLDIPLKQVFIEILVIETSLTNALNFGLEWGGNYKYRNKFGGSLFNTQPQPNSSLPFPDTFVSKLSGLTPPTPPTPIGNIPPQQGFDLGVIGEIIKHNGQTFLTIGSLLTALQTDTETTIITTPKILTQDGRTSTIFSGANIPFTGSFVNNTQSGATIQTSNLEYRDIGLNLTITPVLGNSDIVTLDISLDRSQTATDITQSQLNFQSQTANGIVTSKTTMQTTVHVPDRNFLVLSGFVNNSSVKSKSGIPCLGGLPMIGAAFSQANDTISNQNIVIFLRPYIVNSIDDLRRMTSEQEEFFRDQASTPYLEHNYDESIELIKTIDDE